MELRRILKNTIREIPILDGLPDLQWIHFKEAVKELFFTVLLSTLPLWVGAFAASLIGASTGDNVNIFTTFSSHLVASISSGALIIYSATLIAPVIYIATQESKGSTNTKVFPSRPWHILFAFMIQVVGCVYFLLQYLGQEMNPDFAFIFSVWLFPLTLAMLLIAFCYKNLVFEMDPVREMEHSETAFTDGYSRHRRANK